MDDHRPRAARRQPYNTQSAQHLREGVRAALADLEFLRRRCARCVRPNSDDGMIEFGLREVAPALHKAVEQLGYLDAVVTGFINKVSKEESAGSRQTVTHNNRRQEEKSP